MINEKHTRINRKIIPSNSLENLLIKLYLHFEFNHNKNNTKYKVYVDEHTIYFIKNGEKKIDETFFSCGITFVYHTYKLDNIIKDVDFNHQLSIGKTENEAFKNSFNYFQTKINNLKMVNDNFNGVII